jgi:hypothetical protein
MFLSYFALHYCTSRARGCWLNEGNGPLWVARAA